MPSITYWNRLEPRARSNDLENALAARVRDPAWFLARQWQLGEFQGEDAGSPAYLRIAATVAPMIAWSTADGTAPPTSLAPAVPIERATTAEGVSPRDVALAVQLGQTFDRFLVELGATDLRPLYLAAFAIPASDPLDDPRAIRMRALWQGRAIDGIALYLASQVPSAAGAAPPGVPAAVPAGRQAVALTAVARLVAWVQTVVGDIAAADPVAWRPPQLDYALRVYAGDPSGTAALSLAASPDRDGDLAWHSFDADASATPASLTAPPVVSIKRAVIPGPVRFRGMPNERFWDFEDGRVDFGALTPDRRGLASLLLMDFMLVHGNDWFLVPFEIPVGTLCSSALTMVDVFGTSTAIARADAGTGTAPRPWTMFSTASPTGAPADYFVLPASSATATDDGPVLEDVRFLRDDTADLAWAVERAVEGTLGAPWLAADRIPPNAAASPVSAAPLAYRIQSNVPANWIPFQPVKLAVGDEVALERAGLLSLDGAGQPTLPVPLGRTLEPSSLLAGTPYRVREPVIPRGGVQVIRRARRARGSDGSTHVWVARACSIGTGEGWSGLRFDLAISTTPAPSTESGS